MFSTERAYATQYITIIYHYRSLVHIVDQYQYISHQNGVKSQIVLKINCIPMICE